MYYIIIESKQTKENKMTLKKGDKIESKKMIMVITGETQTSYLGYYEYKERPIGQCSILKDTLNNPHYRKNIIQL